MDKTVVLNTINQIKDGRTDLFKTFVDEYSQPLYVFVSSMMNNAYHAEDIVQDTFLSAFKNIHSYSPQKSAFSTWLFTIAKNRCVNEFKRKKPDSNIRVSSLPDTSNESQKMIDINFFKILDNALARLSDDEKTIFILAEIQEFSYEEINDITKIKVGTIKSKLSRTKMKLRNLLEEKIGENHENK